MSAELTLVADPEESPATESAPKFSGLPYGYAKRNGVLLDNKQADGLTLVHRPDVSTLALLEAKRHAGQALKIQQVSADEFDARLTRYYEGDTDQAADIMHGIGDDLSLHDIIDESMPEPEDLMESSDEAPVIRLLNAILTEAVRKQASDIHIEPFEKKLMIRYRVDGVMQKMIEPPVGLTAQLISRVKVQAGLDISEKRLPQDGRISIRIAGHPVDIRVSTLPGPQHERVVLRLLDKQAGRLDLEQLGMTEQNRNNLETLLDMPHGILLVTGPTGSGKTTTLYAALEKLNNSRRTILTVEDPIEYYIEGVGQTAVHTKVGLTFARGLRAILRQDPDVVMVGEIRDKETAEIAVQASLTGHLVLSTLHTNTAIGAITRLRDMGVEPFLLSSSLIGVIAQRLVRLLCSNCKQQHQASESECHAMGIDPASAPLIYAPHGCSTCNHTGYIGRSGIYEISMINQKLRDMIHDGAGEHALESMARASTPGILDDGIQKVLRGETSLEEVFRVAHKTS
ncbi:MAG: type II secretion system ATPase GspE [Gammaproteobacteria bacterium]|nr:type II secretion system ATPase GspE [Gammaproteobacteria bacterium]